MQASTTIIILNAAALRLFKFAMCRPPLAAAALSPHIQGVASSSAYMHAAHTLQCHKHAAATIARRDMTKRNRISVVQQRGSSFQATLFIPHTSFASEQRPIAQFVIILHYPANLQLVRLRLPPRLWQSRQAHAVLFTIILRKK